MFEINLWLLVILMKPFVNIQSGLYNPDTFSPQTNSVFGLLIGLEFDTGFSSSFFLGVVDLKAEGGAWVEAVCVVGEVR